MKRLKEIETTKQKAIWVPTSQFNEFLALAKARGIESSTEPGTVKALFKELVLEEAERIGFDINENVIRYARMKVK